MQHRKGRNATNNAQIRINCKNFDIFCRNNLHKCEKSSIFVVAFGISMFFRSSENSRSSAVGSAPRSGRGGRAFESPLLDEKGWSEWPSFLSRGTPTPAFLSRCARTIIAAQFTSRLFLAQGHFAHGNREHRTPGKTSDKVRQNLDKGPMERNVFYIETVLGAAVTAGSAVGF